MAATTDLDAIFAKIARAHEHLKLFEDESIAYFKACCPTFDINLDLDQQKTFISFTVEKEPPSRLAVILGDCVHNARSALDNLICALVRKNDPASSCKGRQFPCYTELRDYHSKRDEILRGVADGAKRLIDDLHPCARRDHGIPARMHAVAILNTLSNRDKHRAPNLTAAYSRDTKIDLGIGLALTLKGPLYPNAKVQGPFLPALLKSNKPPEAHGSFHIAFKDRNLFGHEAVLDLMDFCLNFIEKTVVPALKPFLD